MRMHLYKGSANVMSGLANTFCLAICGIVGGADDSGKDDWNVKSSTC